MSNFTQETYEKLKAEFRRLSIGQAELSARILHLQSMIDYVKKHPEVTAEKPEELRTMQIDLEKYEFHLFQEYCESVIQNKKQRVSYPELREYYRIARKFSEKVQNNADYSHAFGKIQKQYKFRTKIRSFTFMTAVLLLGAGILAAGSLIWTEQQLGLHAQKIQMYAAEDPLLAKNDSSEEIKEELRKLQNTFWIFPSEKEKALQLEKLLASECLKKENAHTDRVSLAVGDFARFQENIEKYLEIYPDTAMAETWNLNVKQFTKEFETIQCFTRFVTTAQKEPHLIREKEFGTWETLPVFIPEWKEISQYNSFPELLQFQKETLLLDTIIEIMKTKSPKKDDSLPKEWEYRRKDWSRCYYTSIPPEPAKEGKFRLTVELPNKTTKVILIPKKPQEAEYRITAEKCWKRLLKQKEKLGNESIFQQELFWLKFLTDIAQNEELDPLYKSYFLVQTIQHLKVAFPTAYARWFVEYEKEGEDDSLRTQYLDCQLHLSPEKEGMGRLITQDVDDNSRRLAALQLNEKLQAILTKSYEDAKKFTLPTYSWIGWIHKSEMKFTDHSFKNGSLYVLQYDSAKRSIEWILLGEMKAGVPNLTTELTPAMQFQPVWVKVQTEEKINTESEKPAVSP